MLFIDSVALSAPSDAQNHAVFAQQSIMPPGKQHRNAVVCDEYAVHSRVIFIDPKRSFTGGFTSNSLKICLIRTKTLNFRRPPQFAGYLIHCSFTSLHLPLMSIDEGGLVTLEARDVVSNANASYSESFRGFGML